MNCIAMIAILVAAPLVQAAPETRSCKAALTELAIAAQAAEIAAEAADRAATELDALAAKLEACRKQRNGNAPACTRIADQSKEAALALDLAEEELTLALEEVDAAYDGFDVACSWDDDAGIVLVRLSGNAKASTAPRSAEARTTTPTNRGRT